MKIAILSDIEGHLIGIAPVHDPAGPIDGEGPELMVRVLAQEGQILHELDVEDDFFADQYRITRLHETHRVSEGRLVPREEG
jgi:hypothetical protein